MITSSNEKSFIGKPCVFILDKPGHPDVIGIFQSYSRDGEHQITIANPHIIVLTQQGFGAAEWLPYAKSLSETERVLQVSAGLFLDIILADEEIASNILFRKPEQGGQVLGPSKKIITPGDLRLTPQA